MCHNYLTNHPFGTSSASNLGRRCPSCFRGAANNTEQWDAYLVKIFQVRSGVFQGYRSTTSTPNLSWLLDRAQGTGHTMLLDLKPALRSVRLMLEFFALGFQDYGSRKHPNLARCTWGMSYVSPAFTILDLKDILHICPFLDVLVLYPSLCW